MTTDLSHLNRHQQQNVKDIQVLFPYLTPFERHEWVDRVSHWFYNDFAKTVEVLSENMDSSEWISKLRKVK